MARCREEVIDVKLEEKLFVNSELSIYRETPAVDNGFASRMRKSKSRAVVFLECVFAVAMIMLTAFSQAVTSRSEDDLHQESQVDDFGESLVDAHYNTGDSNEQKYRSAGNTYQIGSSTPQDPSRTVAVIPKSAIFTESSVSYSYKTRFGIYVFPKDSPNSMKLENEIGETLISESKFVVISDLDLKEGESQVVKATERQIVVQTETVSSSGRFEGSLAVTTEFRGLETPKISASFDCEPSSEMSFFRIEWHLMTENTHLSSREGLTWEYSDSSGLQTIGVSYNWIRLSPPGGNKSTSRNVILDWSDAQAGTLHVGKEMVSSGFKVIVKFPMNRAYIDPTVVQENVADGATGYPTQRQVSYASGYYWAFYKYGNRILYRRSHDGNIWSQAYDTGTWKDVIDFGMSTAGSNILICYTDAAPRKDIRFRRGHIVQGSVQGGIKWDVESYTRILDPDFVDFDGPCSVVVANDGTYYVAFSAEYDESIHWLHVYKSFDGGETFYEDFLVGPYFGGVSHALVALTSTKVGLVWAIDGAYPHPYWNIKETEYWGTEQTCTNVNLPQDKDTMFSVIATNDDKIHIAYVEEVSGVPLYVRHAVLQPYSCDWENVYVPNYDSPEFPTISVDGEGFLHVFFSAKIEGGDEYQIRFSREERNPKDTSSSHKWDGLHVPFGTFTNPPKYLSAPRELGSRDFLIWTLEDSSQFNVNFGSFPVLSEASSYTGRPWDGDGLSPYQDFFSNFGQYVSAGNGQLVVSQTDLALEGRGLDLAISRMYVSARASTGQIDKERCSYPGPEDGFDNIWNLDLPCVGDKYLHIWGGQRYPIRWEGDVFENHGGEHFKLERHLGSSNYEYTLYSKDGLVYEFDESRLVTSITDLSGMNEITFQYSETPPFMTITDTIGRQVEFTYEAVDPHFLESISYGGRTVQYGYIDDGGFRKLRTVTDPIGRVTTYAYDHPNNDRLLTSIEYPTRALVEFDYELDNMGTDAIVYRVASERFYDGTTLLKKNDYEYDDVDGRVYFTKVTHYEGQDIKGYTEHIYDPVLGGMRTTRFDESHRSMNDMKVWNGLSGNPEQADVFLGGSTKVNHSAYSSFDDWGNPIYQRDAIGHEVISTYLNTNRQNGWFRGGFTSYFESGGQKTGDYAVLFDDFSDWDYTDWSVFGLPGSHGLDPDTFSHNSPSLLLNTPSGEVTTIQQALSGPAVHFEALLSVGEHSTDHYMLLRSLSNDRVRIMFHKDGYLYYWNEYKVGGPGYQTFLYYYPKTWYWIGIHVDMTTETFDIWLNGHEVVEDVPLIPYPFDIDQIYFKSGDSVNPGRMWIDKVNVYNGGSLKVFGLSAGESIMLVNQSGETITAYRNTAGEMFEWEWIPTSSHAVKMIVLSKDGELDYASPFKIAYPSYFVYTPPLESMHLTLTESGFLETRGGEPPYVDDNLPPDADFNSWNDPEWPDSWTDSPLPASGGVSHRSGAFGGWHYHQFWGASEKMSPTSSDFHVQYVYIQGGLPPTEIQLGYKVGTNTYYAYWGEDKIPRPVKRDMGDIPSQRGRWMMFIVKASELGTAGLDVDGIQYQLFGGTALWDFSALGDGQTGEIIIESGLGISQVVKLMDPDGNVIAQTTSPGGHAILDLYENGITAFPIEGYFRIEDLGGTLEYEGPIIDALWGGDKFSYSSPTNLYPNEVDDNTHSLMAGTYQWQDGPDAPDPVLMETCIKYGNPSSGGENGLAIETKTLHSSGWIYDQFQYDDYGNLRKHWNDLGHMTEYRYDKPGFHNAFLWKAIDASYEEIEYDYYLDPGQETGDLKWAKNPRGYTTSYEYDAIGRITKVHFPEVEGVPSHIEYVYNDPMNRVHIFNERGYETRKTYDVLGRMIQEARIGHPQHSPVKEFEYNWLDQATSYKFWVEGVPYLATTEYDALGRMVKMTNPDGSFRIIEYDDLSGFVTFLDEDGRKKLWAHDYGGRLSSVREYSDTICPTLGYCKTKFTYDEVGNTLSVDDARTAAQQVTHYEYDSLNRLTRITYPDLASSTEIFTYYNDGNLETKTDRLGNPITYYYDAVGRLETIEYPGGDYEKQFQYDANGNVIGIMTIGYQGGYPWAESMVTYGYDEKDRVDYKLTAFDGTVLHGLPAWGTVFEYTYDEANNLKTMKYSDGMVVTYEYDALDRVEDVLYGLSYVASFEYYSDDNIKSIDWGNGLQSLYYYDESRRPETVWYKDPQTSQVLSLLGYEYYPSGNLEFIQGDGFNRLYEYDDFSRVSKFTKRTYNPMQDYVFEYEYDEVGNLLEFTEDGVPSIYHYTLDNRLTDISFPIGTGYTYYDNGDLKTKAKGTDTWYYYYDYEEQLKEVKLNDEMSDPIARFFYDGEGNELFSIESGIQTFSAKSGIETVLEYVHEWGPETRHIYANGLHLAKIVDDFTNPEEWFFYYQDHLGNVRLVTDGFKNIVYSSEYQPFGAQFAVVGSEKYKFTGKPEVPSLGLYNFGARYYDPEARRFITPDPVQGNPSRPQSLNRYSYVLNNPLKFVDPTGEFFFLAVVVIAVYLAAVSVAVPELRIALDAVFMAVGFVPIIGDAISAAYFLTQNAMLCGRGECDTVSIGIDLLSLIPVGGDIAFAAGMAGSVGIVAVKNIGKKATKYADDVAGVIIKKGDDLIGVARRGKIPKGWKVADDALQSKYAGAGYRSAGDVLGDVRPIMKKGRATKYTSKTSKYDVFLHTEHGPRHYKVVTKAPPGKLGDSMNPLRKPENFHYFDILPDWLHF